MTKPAGLTPKREKFAQGVASGKTQAEAYRQAFSVANMAAKTVVEKASRLMADGNVRARVDEIRAPAVEKATITLESHLRDLLALRNLAAKEKQLAAAISAEIARGKAAGVVVDRAALELTGKNGAPLAPTTIDASKLSTPALEELLRLRGG